MQITPLDELKGRVARLQKKLRDGGLDGAIIMENTDLFYFAGSMQQGIFFVPATGEPLFLVRRNYERALYETSWKGVLPFGNLKEVPPILAKHGFEIKRIGLELDVLPVNNYMRFLKLFTGTDFVDISILLREIRMIKSSYEVDCFREAGKVALDIYNQIPSLLQEGKSELQFSIELENLYRRAGHQGILRMRAFNGEMYFGHVYCGENGAMHTFLDSCTGGRGLTVACPQGASRKTLAPHEPIGVDYGAMYEGYILDHTRTFSLGALPRDLQKAYEVAVEIQDAVIKKALPGAACEDLFELALDIAAKRGLADNFMGYGPEQVKFVGHGVGLQVDELPIIGKGAKYMLAEGMVFALEPKFIFPERGMVGLENDWHITAEGPEKLSPIPDNLVTVPL